MHVQINDFIPEDRTKTPPTFLQPLKAIMYESCK